MIGGCSMTTIRSRWWFSPIGCRTDWASVPASVQAAKARKGIATAASIFFILNLPVISFEAILLGF